ncbi:hypothetical protein [Streptomonospora wellingtoniae]|uniref:DUF4350 domain-containing protein n=1 Tax=Streptomonospora wellingtoniae TaxID=3075544 RepID=A0ABU2KT47_9ACTN|nr:hypothetical protein [Streptomonospora sp. DSM 45055]MDT0302454.1 hypothetical protein [Streptomonospora sp. DSM 45055]
MNDAPSPLQRLSVIPAVVALAFLVLLVLPPGEARADIEPPVTAAEHYAELLSEEPEGAAVVVDGAVGGTLTPEEMTGDLHSVFGELGLPYYVVVTPFLGPGSEAGTATIASALHDRLGSDGVYAVLEPRGSALEVEAYGVEADTETALHLAITDPDLRYDDPAPDVAEVLVAALKDPDAAEEARAQRQWPWPFRADTFEGLNPSRPDGPESIGFLSGAVGGAAVAFGVWWLWRPARRGRLLPAAAIGVGTAVVAVGAVTAPTVWVAAAPVGGYERLDAEELARMEEPYVVSTERAARIARALEADPLYVDPLVRLPRDGLDSAAGGIGDAPVPVYAAVVPLDTDDEAGGDHEVLAAAIAALAQREGVYLVAGRGIGDTTNVGAAVHGFGTDYSFGYAMRGIEADTPAGALRKAVAALDEVELTPGGSHVPQFADQEPSTPAPRMERYWVDGVLLGLSTYGLLVTPAAIALGWLALYALRAWRGGGRVVGESALRRLARRETTRLRALLADRSGDLPEELLPQADAALLTMEARPRPLDLLGVVVLARRVAAEAEDPGAAPREPCATNPLHAWAVERDRNPRSRTGKDKVCAHCAALPPKSRAARVLRLRADGTAHAYDGKPNDPWIRHRFGADAPAAMVQALLKEHHVS